MSSAVLPRPHTAEHPLGALRRQWRAWRRRDELDNRLIAGADPASSLDLRCRASHLTARNSRYRLAAVSESIVAAVDNPDSSPLALDLPAQAIRTARRALLELAQQLRRPEPCAPRGVAMCRRLLHDASSPLYEPAAPTGELCRAVRSASRALS